MKASKFCGFFVLTVISLMGFCARAETNGQDLAQNAGRALIGTRAPRLVLRTIDGATIDLGQLYGKQAVYLKFWATWCVPCREQMPHFEHVYETAGADLAVVAINTGFNDSIEEIQKYRQRLGIKMPIVMDDGRAAAAFKLRVTPQHIVIGLDGRILYVGHLADARLESALLQARSAPVHASVDDGPVRAAEAPAVQEYRPGDLLPAHSLPTLDGKQFPFHDPHKTRPTLLTFFSPWCESYLATTRPEVSSNCRRMREAINRLSSDQSIRIVGIASGLWATPQDLGGYRKQYGVGIPLSLDASGSLFRAFSVNEVPVTLLIDRQGRIVRRMDIKELESPATLHLAMEKDPPTP